MTDFIIVKALPEDAEAIANAETAVFSEPWSLSSVEAFLSSPLSRSFAVKDEDGDLAAYCLFQWLPPEGEVLRVATLPAYRRRGLARALLENILKDVGTETDCTVYLEVRSHNAPAIALYRSLGFGTSDVRKNYYRNPQDDALIMQK